MRYVHPSRKENSSAAGRKPLQMKLNSKSFTFTFLIAISLLVAACSGLPGGSQGSNGTPGSFSIGGMVTGLASGSTGLMLANGTDTLAINASGSFTFKNLVASTATYNVTVLDPPVPAQTCTVASASGTPSANVTNILVTCTIGTQAIGVTVAGLTGTGLI